MRFVGAALFRAYQAAEKTEGKLTDNMLKTIVSPMVNGQNLVHFSKCVFAARKDKKTHFFSLRTPPKNFETHQTTLGQDKLGFLSEGRHNAENVRWASEISMLKVHFL